MTPIGRRLSVLLDQVVARGRQDGSVRADAEASDLIVAGAMLAHPHLQAQAWDAAARRICTLMLDGLRPGGDGVLMPPALTRSDLDLALARMPTVPPAED